MTTIVSDTDDHANAFIQGVVDKESYNIDPEFWLVVMVPHTLSTNAMDPTVLLPTVKNSPR